MSTPPIYMAFDCLYLEGRDLRRLPLRERRTELERVVDNDQRLIFPARRLAPNVLEAWREVWSEDTRVLSAKTSRHRTGAAARSCSSRSGSVAETNILVPGSVVFPHGRVVNASFPAGVV